MLCIIHWENLVAYGPLYFFRVLIYYWIIKCFQTLYFLFEYFLIFKFTYKKCMTTYSFKLNVFNNMSKHISFSPLLLYQTVDLFFDKVLGAQRLCEYRYGSRYLERSWCLKFSASSSFSQFFTILLVFFSKVCFSRNSFELIYTVNNESLGVEIVIFFTCLVEDMSQLISFKASF